MNGKTKVEEYNKLIVKVNDCKKCSNKGLEHCPNCNEINLWTYWVGGRDNLNAKILVVGQDWGGLEGPEFECAKEVMTGKSKTYYQGEVSETNDCLAQLFSHIGYNISGGESKLPLTDLFFTNFVLCYRKPQTPNGKCKISGGFSSEWRGNCKEYFKELVNIIQPRIILCLGRDAYKGVCEAAGFHVSNNQSYNSIIAKGEQQMQIGEVTCSVFPLAHPGVQGTLNRCAIDKEAKRSLEIGKELQKKDWERIKEVM